MTNILAIALDLAIIVAFGVLAFSLFLFGRRPPVNGPDGGDSWPLV